MAWKPGVLQSMGSQRVGYDCTTELTKRINYLGLNPPRETKELYIENYDTNKRNKR